MAGEIEVGARSGNSSDRLASSDYLAGLAFFLSGVLALVYEICWIRKASLLFGATRPAVSTVVAVFFGGLALGSWYFGRKARTNTRPLRLYAILEILIGVWAFASPLLLNAMDSVFLSVYDSVYTQPITLLLIRFLIVTVVILPPTILMGGSLPLFVRHYVRHNGRIAKPVGGLYAINTIGAAIGCLVTGLFLFPKLGVSTSIHLAAVINIGLGILVFVLPLTAHEIEEEVEEEEEEESTSEEAQMSAKSEESPQADAEEANDEGEGHEDKEEDDKEEDDEEEDDEDWSFEVNESKVVSWMFFFAGFSALGYEILWTRFLGLVTQNTVYTYTFSLAVVLLGMALGTILTSSRVDQARDRAVQFAFVHGGIGLSILITMLMPAFIWMKVSDPSTVAGQFLVVVLLLGVPSLLIGMAFPIAIRLVVDKMHSASADVGRLLAVNTIGGIVGSLIVGFVLLPFIQMQHTLKLLTVINVLIAVATVMLLENSMSQLKRALFVVVVAGLWVVVPMAAFGFTGTHLPHAYVARTGLMKHEFVTEGTTATLAVLDSGGGVMRLEIDRMWQGSNLRNHQLVAAHVPAFLHPDPSDVLVVGLGAGQTTQAFLAHPEVKKLDCVEIESKLIRIIRSGNYFGDAAWMDGTDNQEVNVFCEDGRNYLTHSKNTYDVISIEVGQVFRPSIGGFYTLEFYQATRKRLNDKGIVCQFVPTDFLRPADFKRVVATFREVFPNCLLWYNTSELLLVGSTADKFEVSQSRLKGLATNKKIKGDLQQAYWGGVDEYLHHQPVFLGGFIMGSVGVSNLSVDVPLLRDEIPSMEYLQRPDDNDFSEPIYAILNEDKESVQQILSFEMDRATARACSTIQDMNLRHLVALKYLKRGDQLLNEAKALVRERKIEDAQTRFAESLEYLRTARARLVRFWPIYQKLAEAHSGLSDVPAAVQMGLEAVKINPQSVETHNLLGFLFALQGDAKTGIKHFRSALKYAPSNIQAINGLARILAARSDRQPGEAEEAVKLAERGFNIQRNQPPGPDPDILDTLAIAYAATGEFRRAVEFGDGAIQLAQQAQWPSTKIEALRHRRALYKAGRPYVENLSRPQPNNPGMVPGQVPGMNPGGNQVPNNPGINKGKGPIRIPQTSPLRRPTKKLEPIKKPGKKPGK